MSSPIRQQLHFSAATGRLEQPRAELITQCLDEQMELVDGESPSPQFRQNQQLEELYRRVATFSTAAGFGQVRRDGRRDESALIPQLQLPRGQAGERRHFARTVGLLEAHGQASGFRARTSSRRIRAASSASSDTLLHLGILRDRRPIRRAGERAMRNGSMVRVLGGLECR